MAGQPPLDAGLAELGLLRPGPAGAGRRARLFTRLNGAMSRQRPATKDGDEAGRKVFRRRQEILDVAARMFYEKGYDATSTRDIAEAAGLLKGSLYYYVETKEDFLFEIIRQSHEGALATLGPRAPLRG